ncbi:ATP-binding protein [Acerihabitans sp. KWT182]|uniref:ATP-binding protein n=1 Tax=Acerihabitans sp. KWT182 TaxID=3157919 RepID=A0AAU7Q6R4_9GAMM
MKIIDISIKNFKAIHQESFSFRSRFTVFIGDNATGKTSILDALAVALGSFFSRPGQHQLQADTPR